MNSNLYTTLSDEFHEGRPSTALVPVNIDPYAVGFPVEFFEWLIFLTVRFFMIITL